MASSGGGGKVADAEGLKPLDATKRGGGGKTGRGQADESKVDIGSKAVEKGSRKKVNIPQEPIKEKTTSIEEILNTLRQPPSDTFKAKLKLKIGNNTADINSGESKSKRRAENYNSVKEQKKEQAQEHEARKEEIQETKTVEDMQSLNLPLPMNPNYKVHFCCPYFCHMI